MDADDGGGGGGGGGSGGGNGGCGCSRVCSQVWSDDAVNCGNDSN